MLPEALNSIGTIGKDVGLPVLGTLGGGALLSRLSMRKTIPEGSAGMRIWRGNAKRRNGEIRPVYGPGPRWRMPFFSDIVMIQTNDRSDHIPSQEFSNPITIDRNDDGSQYAIEASIIWRVKYDARDNEGRKYSKRKPSPHAQNVHRALWDIQNEAALTRAVVYTHCASHIRDVMQRLPADEFKVSEKVDGGVKQSIGNKLEESYGVELLSIAIGNVALTDAQKVQTAIESLGRPKTASSENGSNGANHLNLAGMAAAAICGAQEAIPGLLPNATINGNGQVAGNTLTV